jgi:serine/threonine protein kinase
MAPEMLVSSLSAKSDVYSYGMVLLELVLGRRSVEPGSAAASETADLFARVVRKMVRGELVELVDKAMAHVDVREGGGGGGEGGALLRPVQP